MAGTLDFSSLNTSLRAILRQLLGMPANSVRPANQNAPTGNTTDQFATVLLISADAEGRDQQTIDDVPVSYDLSVYAGQYGVDAGSTLLQERVTGQRRVRVSFQVYRGTDAFTKVSRVGALLQSAAGRLLLQQAGLGFVGAGQPRSPSALVDTFWEDRGQVDLEFYTVSEETALLPTFAEFDVTLTGLTVAP